MNNNNSNNNNNNNSNGGIRNTETLFNLVFKNIVLFRAVFDQVRILKKNDCVKFINLKELREYKEINIVKKIIYSGREMIDIGDLPFNGQLKEVLLSKQELSAIKGNAIPYGVEIIGFCSNGLSTALKTPQLTTLPTSVHTVNDVSIRIGRHETYIIPPNITSISFSKCPNISGIDKDNGYIKIPNTIKSLEFKDCEYWNNSGEKLRKGDIPNSVTNLSIKSYTTMLTKGILPKSVTQLTISGFLCNHCDYIKFDFLSYSLIQSLTIHCFVNIRKKSKLSNSKTLTKLIIYFKHLATIIEPKSLPNSLTDLELLDIQLNFNLIDIIPPNVKRLKLLSKTNPVYLPINVIPNSVETLIFDRQDSFNQIIDQPGILPPSLTHFELNNSYPIENLSKMVLNLPRSLKSITLPKKMLKYINNLDIPSIIKINYY